MYWSRNIPIRLLDLRVLHAYPLHQKPGTQTDQIHSATSNRCTLASRSQHHNIHTVMLPYDNKARATDPIRWHIHRNIHGECSGQLSKPMVHLKKDYL